MNNNRILQRDHLHHLRIGFTANLVVAASVGAYGSVLGLLAALFSIPTGLALAWVLTDAIQLRAFGWTMPFLVSASPLLWTLFIGVSAAWLASLYPAWQASRSDPAPHMRED